GLIGEILSEPVGENWQESFYQAAKEAAMLLQIILGDLENNENIDSLFLSELKTSIDQLRAHIYQLQRRGVYYK
ncbi:MAG: hypothetical protein JNN15_16690, partial [Blastocatellia bacterium]|nr:hypothetical protein [Blastocatellia bacterium]